MTYRFEDYPIDGSEAPIGDRLAAEAIASRVQIHLDHSNFEAAIRVLEFERDRAGEGRPPKLSLDEVLDSPLVTLDIGPGLKYGDPRRQNSTRIVNTLEEKGILTVRQVLKRSRDDLMAIPGMSLVSVAEVARAARAWLVSNGVEIAEGPAKQRRATAGAA